MASPRQVPAGDADSHGGPESVEPAAEAGVPRRLVKRDGREVAFDESRIEAAVMRALTAVGEEDPSFAGDVAHVVTLALAARTGPEGQLPSAPSVEEVQDLVEQALVEMGRARVARAYILYRDRRARSRAALTVAETHPRTGARPWVRAGSGTSPWSAGRIVSALMDEANLPRSVSEDVAERVERRVFDAGLARISTALIREFVDNELMAMGLETALHQQESVGVPRHDLRRMLNIPRAADPSFSRSGPTPGFPCYAPAGGGLADDVADAILGRYALADLLDESTAEQHRQGSIYLEGALRPHLPLTRALPAKLCLRGEPSSDSGPALLEELATHMRGVSHGVVVEGLHAAVAPLMRAARSRDRLRDLLAAMGALSLGMGRRLDLSAPGGRSGSLVRTLLVELAALDRAGRAHPRLFLSWSELSPALEAAPELQAQAESLVARGSLIPIWHSAGSRWVAPGCRRGKREVGVLSCGGGVALNLPRIARQAGPWREDLFFEAMAARIQEGLDGIEALDAFQRRHPAARDGGLRERRGFVLTPVGLVEALRILGDGLVRPEQGARLLGVMGDQTRRLAQERGLSVCVSGFFGEAAASSMARADAALPKVTQARLFADLPQPELEEQLGYSLGLSASSCRPSMGGLSAANSHEPEQEAGELAVLCSTLPEGILSPDWFGESIRESQDAGVTPRLDTWRLFDARRSAPVRPEATSSSGFIHGSLHELSSATPAGADPINSPSDSIQARPHVSQGEPLFPPAGS